MNNLNQHLQATSYPGRGILLGRSADGGSAVIAYFIMGRSENSRNRIFAAEPDGIRTEAFDPSKMVDPSLIIYHPVRRLETENGVITIVTNGDQTDTVRDFFAAGKSFSDALATREFEPDGPNYTPRISGVVFPCGAFALSILKSADGDPASCIRNYFEYRAPLAGEGRFLSTYQGDGSPLPSFEGEPLRVAVTAQSAEALADELWESLNEDNKVSLYTAFIDLSTGAYTSVIRNKLSQGGAKP